MKKTSVFVCMVLLAAAAGDAQSNGLMVIGSRDKSGAPAGVCRIVDTLAGTKVAEGKFASGQMDGLWQFYDSKHVKVAEVTYSDGVASGPCRTYFGSRFNAAAAGKLESEGSILARAKANGEGYSVMPDGRLANYGADGKVFNDVLYKEGKVAKVTAGSGAKANELYQADLEFIMALTKSVIEAR